ncbi:MAG TPA: DUF3048 domain-containing protein [Mycobacteriales bacterium]
MRRLGVLGAAIGLAATLVSCSGGSAPAAAPSPSPATATASPTPSPTPTKRPAPARPLPPKVNPLTGLPGVPKRPVIAVKIDDTGNGRPQIGLEYADVVYVLQVEGGATRLAAVFASRQPGTVGPVRSVRNMDPELFSAYGRAALAYSGGAAGPVARLRSSKLADAGPATRGGFYRRLGSRHAPYNLVVDLAAMARTLPHITRPIDVGFQWAEKDTRVSTARKVSYLSVNVGRIRQSFRWEPVSRRWLRLDANGAVVRTASGRPEATPNVVVQLGRVRLDATDVDVLGTPSAYTSTVGRGAVLLFRDGRVMSGQWARSAAGNKLWYLDPRGRPLTLDPGGAWVLLADRRSPVTFR